MANYLNNKKFQHISVDINTEKLPFSEQSFDVVAAFFVLEHLENYFLILQETTRILKKGGYFIIALPNHLNIFERLRFLFTGNLSDWNLSNNHLLFLTKDVFKKTYLRDFKIVEKHYNDGFFPFKMRSPIMNKRFQAKMIVWRPHFLPHCELFSTKVCYILRRK